MSTLFNIAGICFVLATHATSFNSTGGTFLFDLLHEVGFTYELTSTNHFSFFDGGSKWLVNLLTRNHFFAFRYYSWQM
jgi:hypothetical protein